jgi:hypothetical protein
VNWTVREGLALGGLTIGCGSGPQEWVASGPPPFKPRSAGTHVLGQGLGTGVLGHGLGTHVLGQGLGTHLIILPIYNREYIIRKSEQREVVMRCQSIPGLSEGVRYE